MKLWTNIAVSVVAVLVLLIVTEVFVHALASSTLHNKFPQSSLLSPFKSCQIKNQGSSLSKSFYQLTDNPPGLWYELRPGVSGDLYGTEVSTNSFGMREHETTREKPTTTFRIAVISDSATFGYRVKVEDRWSSILQELLNNQVKSRGVEVLNFAVPGYNTKQELILLENKVLEFKPDLVVFGHSLNDIYGEGTVSIGTSPLVRTLSSRSALFNCFDFQKIAGIKRIFVTDYTLNKPFKEMYVSENTTWKEYQKYFPEISKVVHDNKIPTIFVLMPYLEKIDGDYELNNAYAMIEKAVEDHKMFAVNLSPESGFKYPDATTFLVDPTDFDHLNRKGHNVVAEAVLEKLIKENLLPK